MNLKIIGCRSFCPMQNENKEASTTSVETEASNNKTKIKKVVKRDGRVVDFNMKKIEKAISASLASVLVDNPEDHASLIAANVAKSLEKIFSNQIPNIEDIQDHVEKGISEAGFFEASKSYILYREKHKMLRTQTVIEASNVKFKVKNPDGSTETLDLNDLESRLRFYFDKQADKSILYEILEELRLTLFDGITSQEVNRSLIMALVSRIEKDQVYADIAALAYLDDLYADILGVNLASENFEETYAKTFRNQIKFGVEEGRLDPKMLKFNFRTLSKALVPERDKILGYKSVQMLMDKYVLKDTNQHILELPQYFWMRVSMGLALKETEKEEKAIEFYNALSQLLYVASSPTLYHAGLIHSQMSSCFLMTVEDDLAHIFKSFGDQAQLAKYAGGIGLDWTNIRSTGSMIKTTNVPSQGVIPFLKICDSTNAAINRSGRKRGAAVVYIEPWHFDIESFLELRRNVGDERRRTHNINTALWIPDLFMKRLIADDYWTLFSPDETPELHQIYGKAFEKKYIEYEAEAEAGNMVMIKKVKAQDIWRKIITMLFETGHPWITFKDPCNIRSPQDHIGVVHSSNLCTEITLNTSVDEVAVCNLGSVNLSNHALSDGTLDRDLLAGTIKVAMRMLDNVIDLNFYPIVETENSNMRHRPVGLGIMGFQDILSKSGVSFDSEVAVKLSDEIQEFVAYSAILASSELAQERGAYQSFKGSQWDRGLLPQDTFKIMEEERGVKTHIDPNGKLDWTPVRASIKKHGMRNSNCMAIAPTASISNLAGCFPSIEPPYSNLYVKSNMFGEFIVSNTYLVEELKEIDLWNDTMLRKIKANDGNIQNISEIPVHIRSKYKGAFDIDPHWIIRHAAHRSKWIDQSQSINIFTNTTKGSVLSEVYIDAWKSGLKTTYYLRSLAASSIEKSTVSLASQGVESPADQNDFVSAVAEVDAIELALQSSVVEDVVVERTEVYSIPEKVESTNTAEITYEFNACRLEDPTCESCQ